MKIGKPPQPSAGYHQGVVALPGLQTSAKELQVISLQLRDQVYLQKQTPIQISGVAFIETRKAHSAKTVDHEHHPLLQSIKLRLGHVQAEGRGFDDTIGVALAVAVGKQQYKGRSATTVNVLPGQGGSGALPQNGSMHPPDGPASAVGGSEK